MFLTFEIRFFVKEIILEFIYSTIKHKTLLFTSNYHSKYKYLGLIKGS